MDEGQRNGKFSQNGKLVTHVRVTKCRLFDSQVRDHAYYVFRFKCKKLRPYLSVHARSMEVMLWQKFEYYRYYSGFITLDTLIIAKGLHLSAL